ncbi:MAG: WhiB family transcriptional regulator [Pseudonocardia sp.]
MTTAGSGPELNWRSRAACTDADPDLFFPVAVSGPVLARQVAVAKAVCAGCPVRAECLADALAGLPYGIAGGLTAEERHVLRSRVEAPVRPVGPPPAATAAELAEAGRAAIRAGRPVGEVAAEFGVSLRSALRWAARVRRAERGAA